MPIRGLRFEVRIMRARLIPAETPTGSGEHLSGNGVAVNLVCYPFHRSFPLRA